MTRKKKMTDAEFKKKYGVTPKEALRQINKQLGREQIEKELMDIWLPAEMRERIEKKYRARKLPKDVAEKLLGALDEWEENPK